MFVSDPDLIPDGWLGEKRNGCDHHLIRSKVSIDHELTENKATKLSES